VTANTKGQRQQRGAVSALEAGKRAQTIMEQAKNLEETKASKRMEKEKDALKKAYGTVLPVPWILPSDPKSCHDDLALDNGTILSFFSWGVFLGLLLHDVAFGGASPNHIHVHTHTRARACILKHTHTLTHALHTPVGSS
jgi:hypothetical protein